MLVRFAVCSMVLATMCSAIVSSDTKAAPARPKDSDAGPKTSRDTTKLLAQYRRAKGDPQKQAEVLDEALSGGPATILAFQKAVYKEIQPQLERYRSHFQRQAAAYAKNHPRKVDLKEVAHIRQPVLALIHGEPTKEEIVANGDPAIARLTELFVIPRADVLANSKEMQTEREQLEALGALWEKVVAAVMRDAPAEGGDQRQFRFSEYLDGEEEIAASLAVPLDPKTQQVLAANAKLAGQIDPEEARTVLALNLTRNLLGLQALLIDPKLCAAARDHSKDMEEKKFFAHESPVPGKKTPWDRAKRFGTSAAGENIFAGSPDGKVANLAWFHSPGHFKNMLGDHQRVGVGRSGVHFTEMLGD